MEEYPSILVFEDLTEGDTIYLDDDIEAIVVGKINRLCPSNYTKEINCVSNSYIRLKLNIERYKIILDALDSKEFWFNGRKYEIRGNGYGITKDKRTLFRYIIYR